MTEWWGNNCGNGICKAMRDGSDSVNDLLADPQRVRDGVRDISVVEIKKGCGNSSCANDVGRHWQYWWRW